MDTISAIAQLRDRVNQWQASGERIAFVPTMGNLHAGHLELIKAAAGKGSRVLVSIFVNPLQFAPGEDFEKYPRTLADDREQLSGLSVDCLFTPDTEILYPRGKSGTAMVVVPELSDVLCGASRPGHFAGVATVVAKLFNLVQPSVALFGKKDYQQLLIIRRMVQDLNFPTEIIGVETVREHDGLAMSSRNQYLSAGERAKAPELFRVLSDVKRSIMGGARDYPRLEQDAMQALSAHGFAPEYVEVRRSDDLLRPSDHDQSLVLLAAARLGQARLIDNLEIRC